MRTDSVERSTRSFKEKIPSINRYTCAEQENSLPGLVSAICVEMSDEWETNGYRCQGQEVVSG